MITTKEQREKVNVIVDAEIYGQDNKPIGFDVWDLISDIKELEAKLSIAEKQRDIAVEGINIAKNGSVNGEIFSWPGAILILERTLKQIESIK